ncbi:hypothetical protein V498_09492 [Pseudogymnoascus sp. VKM F-4517 (FW-2822)]|nr:hypothetical protein V498_09492 [Pseudogymnoascus sp. VKM F-4517 (FW-2822)]
MSLSSYLASKYLTADPGPSSSSTKKRKRKTKDTSASTGLIIADDDADWAPVRKDDDDDNITAVTSGSTAEFRKAKQSAWKSVREPVGATQGDDAQADAIVAQAARENEEAGRGDEDPSIVKMGDGTHAGLQSGAAVAEQMERAARRERARWEKEEREGEGRGKEEETVYRDATGRRIDISMRRAEARREEEERARKERREREEMGGDRQKEVKEKRKEELEEARFMPVARGIEDEELNRELKGKLRWDDPAMAFLTQKEEIGGGGGGGSTAAVGTGRKTYKGAAAPNRYGIRPGHRWDGVDRGNGWEGERFRALNRTKRNKELDFAWQEDT